MSPSCKVTPLHRGLQQTNTCSRRNEVNQSARINIRAPASPRRYLRQEQLTEVVAPTTSPGDRCYSVRALCLHHPPLSAVAYIVVPTQGGSRHLLIQNLEEIPTNPQGSRSPAPKTQRLCKSNPACVYLPSVSACTTGTSIVPCVAIIACNLHRIRAGNSALISNNAGGEKKKGGEPLSAQELSDGAAKLQVLAVGY